MSAARHVYGGRLIHVNETFDADPRDAEDLIALNFARRAATRAMTTQDAAALTRPKRRQYHRRDMKAEES